MSYLYSYQKTIGQGSRFELNPALLLLGFIMEERQMEMMSDHDRQVIAHKKTPVILPYRFSLFIL